MDPKRFSSLLALAAAVCVIWWISRPQPIGTASQPVKAEAVAPPAPLVPSQAAKTSADVPLVASDTSYEPNKSYGTNETNKDTASNKSLVASTNPDLESLQTTFRDYRTALGENPVGTNAEITRALLGDNLKQLQLSVPDGSRVNGKGEMVDRWGTPYFFHQLSAKQMEIRSAGPDRKMWTPDDRFEH